MNNAYQLSVVIPVLNNMQQFSQLLQKLIAYNQTEMEIIVIDGGSSDGTIDIIKQYEEHISYWESGRDKGIADAFNRGIEYAQGQVVAILNSDDYWQDDTLQHVFAAFKAVPDADIYYGDLQFVDEQKNTRYIKKPNLKRMKYRMNIFHPAMFISKKAYQKIGLYSLDYHYAMDSEWCHRALEAGLNFHYIPHVLTSMRLGGVSDIHFKKSMTEYKRSVIAHHLAAPVQASAYYYFFLLMRYLMNNHLIWTIVRKLS